MSSKRAALILWAAAFIFNALIAMFFASADRQVLSCWHLILAAFSAAFLAREL